MPPVVMKNRMRTRSASRMETSLNAFSPDKKKSPGSRAPPPLPPPRRQFQIDEGFVMSKEDLARSIAEFRVGLPPLWSSSKSSLDGSTEKVDDEDIADQNCYSDEPTTGSFSSSSSPSSPVTKDESREPNIISPNDHTQTTANINIIQSLDEPQTLKPENVVGNASLEDVPSQNIGVSNRRGFTASEKELLEAAFHISENPGSATMKLLVHLTGLDKKKIRGWFRTRRLRQEREESTKKDTSENENATSSTTQPTYQVPPQYWPEPLRLSHMQLPNPLPGYQAPPGLLGMAPGMHGVAPGVPPFPSKAPLGSWYPLPSVPAGAPPTGFLPPPNPMHPAFGYNSGLPPPHPLHQDGELPKEIPSNLASATSAPSELASTGPWHSSTGVGHPLQDASSVSSPMPKMPSGLLPGRSLHSWPPLGCYGAPGASPGHTMLPPYLLNPAMPFFNPWCRSLPSLTNPAQQQTVAKGPLMNPGTLSPVPTVKPVQALGNGNIQEDSEAEVEASSSA